MTPDTTKTAVRPLMFSIQATKGSVEATGGDCMRAAFFVGERDEHTPAYDLNHVGTLTMSPGQWAALAEALTKGVKRPHVVTFV